MSVEIIATRRMYSKKQQQLLEQLQTNDYAQVIAASLQVVSDLQLQQISLDDYTEAFSQVSLHFEEIEQAFVQLAKTYSEEELFYQI